MFLYQSSIIHNNPITLTYGMSSLVSGISFSLEKDEVVTLDCGVFYAVSYLQPLNKASMKIRCDISAEIWVIEYSLRRDDDKSNLISIKRVGVCEVCSLLPNKLVI